MFLEEIVSMGKGVNIFRPIVLDKSQWGEIQGESFFRGGNTLVFNPDALDIPNLSPKIDRNGDAIVLRRSDFIWAIIQKYVFERKIYEALLPMRHHRRLQDSSFVFNENKLARDIFGLVFYRTLVTLLKQKEIDSITDNDMRKAVKGFKRKWRETIIKLKINNLRSQFLAWRVIHLLNDYGHWWFENEYRPHLNDKIQRALFTMKSLKYEIGKRKFQRFVRSIAKDGHLCNEDTIRDFLNEIKEVIK